ncbi:hypothetical protein DPMN_012924 [Dreissena polymorpha]|uniref:Uncharacterized protein n=1 Tax=Dreissena polymorpha TaxID=45954 RepID=A0A9D4N6S3_DREPO|nr:hypothetical protein DPMN_012924 [Dreissena polymorpha]
MFELDLHIIQLQLLTKCALRNGMLWQAKLKPNTLFSMDRNFDMKTADGAIIVRSSVHKPILWQTDGLAAEKYCPGQAHNIIGTNLLTKFHEDRKINVASRVLTRKNAPPPRSHVFQPTGIIFELFQDIIGMNLLTKFNEDWTVNVASRVFTRFYYSHTRKIAPPLGSHTINVASRVLTRKNAPPPGGHVFKAIKTIFELIQDIIGTNLLTKFHDDQTINVTSRVLTRKNAPPPWWPYIIKMNLLTEFHEDRTINVASRVKNAPPLGSHVFQSNVTIFELIQNINKTNLLTKFHKDWTNKCGI